MVRSWRAAHRFGKLAAMYLQAVFVYNSRFVSLVGIVGRAGLEMASLVLSGGRGGDSFSDCANRPWASTIHAFLLVRHTSRPKWIGGLCDHPQCVACCKAVRFCSVKIFQYMWDPQEGLSIEANFFL